MPHRATFRFHAELNDFLPPDRRDLSFDHAFLHRASVKDMIESLGVPHTEIELILANDAPVDFSYIVQDGDRIAVYPSSSRLPATARLRPPLTDYRFVLDTHLGRLASYLRMLGFDVIYQIGSDDPQLAHLSTAENRILLTRDRGLLKRSEVIYGYYVRATAPRLQLAEVIQRFNLATLAAPFTRCLHCNSLLQPASKESIAHRLQPRTAQFFDDFRLCPSCDRLYWPGSHHQHMQKFIQHTLDAA